MAHTLYIIEDKLLNGLPKSVRDKLMAEAKNLLSFIPKFQILIRQPAQFPTRIDFTDAIVKLVETDDEIGAVHNEAIKKQLKNIDYSIRANNIQPNTAPFERVSATPERGGVGWHKKDVTTGTHRLAITQTGGVASLRTVLESVVQEFAPNKWNMDDAKSRRNSLIAKAKVSRDEQKEVEKANQAYEKSRVHWEIMNRSLSSWPPNFQEAVGVALARLVAHEARHQYLIEHFDQGGLGSDAAELYGNPKTEKFHADDQAELLDRLVNLEKIQKTATIHIETLPKQQPFPF